MVMSWIAGILCTGVVLTLLWLALPIVPALASVVGDTLRAVLP